jgi:hypothetical protein
LVENYSFDAIFSGGLQLNFDKYIIFAEGNYSIGLTNLLKPGVFEVGSGVMTATIDVDELSSIKINSYNILVGAKIPVIF